LHRHIGSYFIVLLLAIVSFFFSAPATPEIYTLSLHDALPISSSYRPECSSPWPRTRSSPSRVRAGIPTDRSARSRVVRSPNWPVDRKSTRLNSSHVKISYAVFCLKKKKKKRRQERIKTKHNDN